jgi:hypothetical protein
MACPWAVPEEEDEGVEEDVCLGWVRELLLMGLGMVRDELDLDGG